jgi:REP element-mobilizing transposase RayT
MPDHLHVVFLGEKPDSDSWKAMVSFKQQSGYWLRLYHPGVQWQKGFFDHIIRSDAALALQVRYIAENPVRKGLVTEWDAYPYTGSFGFDLRAVVEGIALG